MTNWLTLHEPSVTHEDPRARIAGDGAITVPGKPFHLRADIITEIVPGAGETLVRTSHGGQYVCAETAEQVLEMVQDATRPVLTVRDGEIVPLFPGSPAR